MTYVLQSPTVETILPSPEWGDNYKNDAKIDLKRTMSNVVFTYIKSSSIVNLSAHFILTRPKTLELIEFVKEFYATEIEITDHNGSIWHGFIKNDPVEFTAIQVGEVNELTLEFEVTPG